MQIFSFCTVEKCSMLHMAFIRPTIVDWVWVGEWGGGVDSLPLWHVLQLIHVTKFCKYWIQMTMVWDLTLYIIQCQLPMYVPRFNSIIFGQISSSSETWWNKFCWVKLPPLKRNIILQHWPFYTTLKALHLQVVFIWPWSCVHMIIWPERVKI